MKSLKLNTAQQGRRLDVVVGEWLGIHRSEAARLIKNNWILVGAKTAKAGYVTRLSDHITYQPPPTETVAVMKPKIIYEDAAVIVIDKPAGIIVHPAGKHDHAATVVDFARTFTSDADQLRPGIVHRLDRDTSGLLIIAKTAAAKASLQRDFRGHKVEKEYLALVTGHLSPAAAEINLPIAPGRGVKRQVHPAGKLATTRYQVVRRFNTATLVKAWPRSGRTHQLRVHFAAIGHPIVGDQLYGHADPKLQRHFLHAHRLAFRSPLGQWIDVSSPLPKSLKNYLQGLE